MKNCRKPEQGRKSPPASSLSKYAPTFGVRQIKSQRTTVLMQSTQIEMEPGVGQRIQWQGPGKIWEQA
jgi:hypothetical protein